MGKRMGDMLLIGLENVSMTAKSKRVIISLSLLGAEIVVCTVHFLYFYEDFVATNDIALLFSIISGILWAAIVALVFVYTSLRTLIAFTAFEFIFGYGIVIVRELLHVDNIVEDLMNLSASLGLYAWILGIALSSFRISPRQSSPPRAS